MWKTRRFYSQSGQDKMVLEILNWKKKGVFVDIGANDGVKISNTYAMEKRGWTGACVEPDTDVFQKLKKKRKCKLLNAAISDKTGEAMFTKITGYSQMLSGLSDEYEDKHVDRIKTEIEEYGGGITEVEISTYTFGDMMDMLLPGVTDIDYVSIDTEGNEPKILKSIDFDKYDISVLSAENNYNDEEIREYMRQKGFDVQKCGADDIFIKKR